MSLVSCRYKVSYCWNQCDPVIPDSVCSRLRAQADVLRQPNSSYKAHVSAFANKPIFCAYTLGYWQHTVCFINKKPLLKRKSLIFNKRWGIPHDQHLILAVVLCGAIYPAFLMEEKTNSISTLSPLIKIFFSSPGRTSLTLVQFDIWSTSAPASQTFGRTLRCMRSLKQVITPPYSLAQHITVWQVELK